HHTKTILIFARVHCAVPEIRTPTPPQKRHWGCGRPRYLHRVTAVTAKGKRPVPFRTRKLSPSAPMVLHRRRCGRVGRSRTTIHKKRPIDPKEVESMRAFLAFQGRLGTQA